MCELLGGALAGEWTAQPAQERAGTIINHMLMFVVDPAIQNGSHAPREQGGIPIDTNSWSDIVEAARHAGFSDEEITRFAGV